jgi:hypothetical protein
MQRLGIESLKWLHKYLNKLKERMGGYRKIHLRRLVLKMARYTRVLLLHALETTRSDQKLRLVMPLSGFSTPSSARHLAQIFREWNFDMGRLKVDIIEIINTMTQTPM